MTANFTGADLGLLDLINHKPLTRQSPIDQTGRVAATANSSCYLIEDEHLLTQTFRRRHGKRHSRLHFTQYRVHAIPLTLCARSRIVQSEPRLIRWQQTPLRYPRFVRRWFVRTSLIHAL
jgi:hypothetical protein